MNVSTPSLLVLNLAGVLISLGGLYDLFTPRLPAHLASRCEGNPAALELVRALLRALGGCLVPIGLTVAALADIPARQGHAWALGIILVLVVPAEGLNAWGMYRVGSPYYVPAGFILLALVGVALGIASQPH